MKKITLFFVLTILFFSQFIDFSGRGFYNKTFHIIVCHSDQNCYHEIGHAIDHSLGWISKSQEYAIALNAYILRAWDYPEFRDEMVEEVLTFPGFFVPSESIKDFSLFWYGSDRWGGSTELYADMLAWVDGNRNDMPVFFVDFYDWELAEKLIAKYIN